VTGVGTHRWLERVWYEGAPSGAWLIPFGWIFGALTGLRRGLYGSGMLPSYGVDVPVIVVGNITVGGTGKTPLVIWLVEELRRRGFRPGVVSRGFGGTAVGPMLVAPSMDAREVGDEPLLIAARTHCSVAIARDRVAGARFLCDSGVDVIIADDGLQHYRLRRNCEVAVIDGERRLGNGRQLPAGPLRESRSRLRNVDLIAVNGGAYMAGGLAMHLVEGHARSLTDGAERALEAFSGESVHAVAGIGNPQRFFAALRRRGLNLIEHPFPDHHAFRPHELDFGDAHPLLMTEKDAVKCRSFARPGWWTVPVSVEFDARTAEYFMAAILRRITKQSGNDNAGS
jgi:tetraacyldisaccharide 4'-kinase